MMDLNLRRRFYAEEIEAVSKLRSTTLVDAFAAVPRERFLPPGPWTVLADIDFGMSASRTRTTADADPARVYHNIAVAIDSSRQLFNGQPGTIGAWIDLLDPTSGKRVLHIGCGLGYFTAVIAQCTGPTGRVVAYEVDERLAAGARGNLATMDWVDVRHGDASQLPDGAGAFDAILVNAGVTHPLPVWIDALARNGRIMLPLTTSMAALGAAASSSIGKGLVFLITRDGESFSARVVSVVAIYSAIGIRDASMSDALGKAMMKGPMQWQQVTRLRIDAHDPEPGCWYHGSGFCLSENQ